MNLTGNQALQILWIHEREPTHDLGLTETELISLGLQVVFKFDELTVSYKDYMIPKTKDELATHLRDNGHLKQLFHITH